MHVLGGSVHHRDRRRLPRVGCLQIARGMSRPGSRRRRYHRIESGSQLERRGMPGGQRSGVPRVGGLSHAGRVPHRSSQVRRENGRRLPALYGLQRIRPLPRSRPRPDADVEAMQSAVRIRLQAGQEVPTPRRLCLGERRMYRRFRRTHVRGPRRRRIVTYWALYCALVAAGCRAHPANVEIAKEPPDCSKVCRRFGQCALVAGACVVADDRSCRGADVCRLFGECRVAGGRCVPTRDGCMGSTACEQRGLCAFRMLEGQETCGPREPVCRSMDCEQRGQCSSNGFECKPHDDSDCRRSEFCKVDGDCTKVDSYCAPRSGRDCSGSHRCVTDGLCRYDGHIACRAGSPEDCARSERCKKDGSCAPGAASCIPKLEEHCRASTTCLEQGNCHLVGEACAATSIDDCRAATMCHRRGGCTFSGGACRPSFATFD